MRAMILRVGDKRGVLGDAETNPGQIDGPARRDLEASETVPPHEPRP
jgi:hypothetical protein